MSHLCMSTLCLLRQHPGPAVVAARPGLCPHNSAGRRGIGGARWAAGERNRVWALSIIGQIDHWSDCAAPLYLVGPHAGIALTVSHTGVLICRFCRHELSRPDSASSTLTSVWRCAVCSDSHGRLL